jgi:hypothetical protein
MMHVLQQNDITHWRASFLDALRAPRRPRDQS